MSKTADLSAVATPPARPTPTPIPSPALKVLRPSWLPEKMAVSEERQPAPESAGVVVTLRFDPRPNDKPHDVMTLTEMPKTMPSPGGAPDPQESHEQIGGRDVTIIRRGEGCVSFRWEQDGLVLSLTNPYDPPGEPGEVRYSCEQMRKVIESVK